MDDVDALVCTVSNDTVCNVSVGPSSDQVATCATATFDHSKASAAEDKESHPDLPDWNGRCGRTDTEVSAYAACYTGDDEAIAKLHSDDQCGANERFHVAPTTMAAMLDASLCTRDPAASA